MNPKVQIRLEKREEDIKKSEAALETLMKDINSKKSMQAKIEAFSKDREQSKSKTVNAQNVP